MPAIVCVENLEWDDVFKVCLNDPRIIEDSCDQNEINEKIPRIKELFENLQAEEDFDCYDDLGIYFALNELGRILIAVDLDEDSLITTISISELEDFIKKCKKSNSRKKKK